MQGKITIVAVAAVKEAAFLIPAVGIVGTQLLGIVEILNTQRESEHALADHDRQGIFDETLVLRVAEAACELAARAGVAASLAQKQHTGAAGKMAAAGIRKYVGNTLPSAVRGVIVAHGSYHQRCTQLTPGVGYSLVRNAG